MQSPASVDEFQRRQDGDPIRLLAIFYFVAAGVAVLGIGLLFLHYLMFSTLASDPNLLKNVNPAIAPISFSKIMGLLIWFYVVFGIAMVAAAILNLLTGVFLLRRKHRVFSIVVASFNCLQAPLGTILGVFTIVVLSRESVRRMFDGEKTVGYASRD